MQDFQISEQMAELIGAVFGDGNLYDKNNASFIEICGNPKTDAHYFQNVLVPIVSTILKKNPRVFVRSHGLRFRIYSKSFIRWLNSNGVPSGEDRSSAPIPQFVIANENFLKCCIRGIFDTDGSIYFDKRRVYRKPYPRLELHMENTRLLEQTSIFLNKLGIKCGLTHGQKKLRTAGVKPLKTFLQRIGFSNNRHISRIKTYFPELLQYNCAPVAQLAEQIDTPA